MKKQKKEKITNAELCRDIVKMYDKLMEMETYYGSAGRKLLNDVGYDGLRLASILCREYEMPASAVNCLLVSKWYDLTKTVLELLKVAYK